MTLEVCATCNGKGWVSRLTYDDATEPCPKCGEAEVEDDTLPIPQPGHYRVWCPEYGASEAEFGREVSARDAGEAAGSWARSFDAKGDYSIAAGSGATVHVRGSDGVERQFRVWAYSEPVYHSREVL